MLKFLSYFGILINVISLIEKPVIGQVFAGDEENVLDDDRGFGRDYNWKKLEQGFEEAKEMNKPIFVVVHLPSCPACRELKKTFSKSEQLIDLSRQFVMVNVPNHVRALSDGKFHPNGINYVPRIMFYTSQGEIILEAINSYAGDSRYYNYYSDPSHIAETMKYVIEHRS